MLPTTIYSDSSASPRHLAIQIVAIAIIVRMLIGLIDKQAEIGRELPVDDVTVFRDIAQEIRQLFLAIGQDTFVVGRIALAVIPNIRIKEAIFVETVLRQQSILVHLGEHVAQLVAIAGDLFTTLDVIDDVGNESCQ